MPLNELRDRFYADSEVPRCGVTQRVFHANRSCGELRSLLGPTAIPPELLLSTPVPPSTTRSALDVASGAVLIEAGVTDLHCAARERRMWRPGCGDDTLQCTAGGECVALGQPPAFVSFSSP